MGRALASGRGAVMTAETGTGDAGMIEVHRGPVGADMAIVTGVRTLDMCRTLASRRRPIVTTETGARDSGMIEVHRGPVGIDVTVLTSIGRL